MNDPRNKEFKDHVKRVEKHFKGSSMKLLNHMLTPFTLMDDVSKDKERWSLAGEGSNKNIFMYASMLGSGFITVLTVLMIQLVVPGILLHGAITNPTSGHLRFNVDGNYNFSDPEAKYLDEW
jgi:hypothetical protein